MNNEVCFKLPLFENQSSELFFRKYLLNFLYSKPKFESSLKEVSSKLPLFETQVSKRFSRSERLRNHFL